MTGWDLGGQSKGPQDFTVAGGTPIETWYYANVTDCIALATGAPAAAALWALPFIAPARGGTIDRIGFNCTATGANSRARVGLYASTSPTNIYPGTLLADGGEKDTSTTTGALVTTVSVALTPGALYWLAYLCQATAPTIRAVSVTGCGTILGVSNALGTAQNIGITVAQAYGSMPDPFTAAGAYFVAVPIPALAYRFSA